MTKKMVRITSLVFFFAVALISHILGILILTYGAIFMLGFTVSAIMFGELERLEWFCLSKGVPLNIGGEKDVSKAKSKRAAKDVRKTK